MNNLSLKSAQNTQELQVLYRHLVISLKFHHSQTFAHLPRDLALQAINHALESAQNKSL
jgi:hypothetical protein